MLEAYSKNHRCKPCQRCQRLKNTVVRSRFNCQSIVRSVLLCSSTKSTTTNSAELKGQWGRSLCRMVASAVENTHALKLYNKERRLEYLGWKISLCANISLQRISEEKEKKILFDSVFLIYYRLCVCSGFEWYCTMTSRYFSMKKLVPRRLGQMLLWRRDWSEWQWDILKLSEGGTQQLL